MNKILRVKNSTGLTLIELLVVISIISLMAALTLPRFRVGGEMFILQESVNRLAQNLRRAQDLAMSVKEFEGELPYGYGIYLTQGERNFLLYADFNENKMYDHNDDGQVEIIDLGKRIYIRKIYPAISPLSINFNPPRPTTTFSPGINIEEVIITLGLKNTEKYGKIIINRAGLIAVK